MVFYSKKLFFILTLSFFSYNLFTEHTYACVKPLPFDMAELRSANIVIKAEILSYNVLERKHKAEILFLIKNVMKGKLDKTKIIAIWEHPTWELPDEWNESRNVIVVLKNSNGNIMHFACGTPYILEGNPENNERLLRITGSN